MPKSTEEIPSRKSVKVFKARKSLFIHLFETNEYIRGFYNVCELQMVLVFVFVVIRDSFAAGRLHVDLSMEYSLFGGPHHWSLFAVMELIQLIGCVAVYPVFTIWHQSYLVFGYLAHAPFMLLYGGYVVGSWYSVYHASHWLNLPPVFKVISSIETVSSAIGSLLVT